VGVELIREPSVRSKRDTPVKIWTKGGKREFLEMGNT
jgi:hypothetical protein